MTHNTLHILRWVSIPSLHGFSGPLSPSMGGMAHNMLWAGWAHSNRWTQAFRMLPNGDIADIYLGGLSP